MKIGADHFLEGATRDLIRGGAAMAIRRVLIIHFTSGMSAQSSIESMRARGLSCHLVIDRDGAIYQCRGFNRTCGHAGRSRWRDPNTGKLYKNVNAFGIGIELANAGDSVSGNPPRAFGKYPLPSGSIRARHKNGGPDSMWETFAFPQLTSCFAAAKAIVSRYNLDDVCGHEDIAPERKNDPGPAFPMADLREACGFTGLPKVHRA